MEKLKNFKSEIGKTNTIGAMSSVNNPIINDSSLLSYYADPSKYNEDEIFDRNYDQGLKLMCGDRLLKPASSINSVLIRKTTTPGLYKLILNNPELTFKVRYIDETQLVNNREYCAGMISKLDKDNYEFSYFDEDDEIVIEHFDKKQVIDFMNKNKLIFQI